MLLVHKKSGGILEELCRCNTVLRGEKPAVYDRDLSCEKLGLDPDEWWEVDPKKHWPGHKAEDVLPML